ncbi:alpha-D-ribose 1-methylphosphonate 5-triphosphate diphosphatase [Desulfoluna spongiiphila]|uniref:Alpha-D-ribose 1-methylphosphonate 5-triphosphate diphosphatase n=1 Tax=Desulfoluna spongiiphila TaxID=419481 RepID=A0A1G5DXI6_9BACT|nr:alpha-D-ribose 1-methylphosphonate 5-triphosphate diphosphatase [Desulfoluna spongiiphila]SCY19337.1 alpha-D-ribose 1-methylphosphonate 5-triphosphate diphosphatase [Desulfoluna spongiiphila]
MDSTICLTGGAVFDGEHLLERGSVLFSEEGILEVVEGDRVPRGTVTLDAGGRLIMPGLVDLHSDALEQSIEMRPGVYFDFEFALRNLDCRIASCGITTYCHALSFADNELGLRSPGEVERIIRMVKAFDRSSGAMARHLVHARYEIGAEEGLKVLTGLLDEGLIDMVSVMDHTPGQGQFTTLGAFVDYYAGTCGDAYEEIVGMAHRKVTCQEAGWKALSSLSSRVSAEGLPFLSHDDDTPEKIGLVKVLGAGASEFPLSIDAAERAVEEGLKVFMGAPNLVRGRSSGGHLKAAETVSRGICDGLLSDYYPECMLQAPFTAMESLNTLPEYALSLVTSGPGRFIRPGLGTLTPGEVADLLVVDHTEPWARIVQSWVGGRMVHYAAPGIKGGEGVPDCVTETVEGGGPRHERHHPAA